MKVILGLGNPGPRYDDTRHNAGWWVVDLGPFVQKGLSLVARGQRGGHKVLLLKPLTYMNRSGAALTNLRVGEVFDVATDLLVVVDDVTIPPGKIRFRPSGSAGGHNGLKSVQAVLGSDQYARLRIGVGARPPGMDLAGWVLSRMEPEDEEAVQARLPGIAQAVECWMDEGIEAAMSRFNG